MAKTINIGYSPCPNDTFIFYALIHKKIDTHGIEFHEILEDVETLNTLALSAQLDVTKVSCHAFGHLRDRYVFLRSGGAFGHGCGPLVVARQAGTLEGLKGKRIAIPGRLTTASLLLQLYDPCLNFQVIPMPFSRIMAAVSNGEADAGLIIHEGRFTFKNYGLTQILDLGQWWESETGQLIPLGGILALRTLGHRTISMIESLITDSIQYSYGHPSECLDYIKCHSQELDDSVIGQHIALYVNEHTIELGKKGRDGLVELLTRTETAGIIPRSSEPVFLENFQKEV